MISHFISALNTNHCITGHSFFWAILDCYVTAQRVLSKEN